MIADGSSEPLGEAAAANRVRIVIILSAAGLVRRTYPVTNVSTDSIWIVSRIDTVWRRVATAALKMRVQNLELYEKQNAQIEEQVVYPDDGGHADGDGAGLDEKADPVPRIHGRVEGVSRSDRKLPVLHGNDEQQSDHEKEAQDAKPVEDHAAEQQVFVQDFIFAANWLNRQLKLRYQSTVITSRSYVES